MTNPTSAQPRRRRRKLQILLVDDEAPIRQLLVSSLEGLGHAVTQAASAEAALAIAEVAEKPFHVLISDLVMPGMHGDELARRLLDRDDRLRVLLVSGYVERAATLDPEKVSFLAKPFSLQELAERIEAIVPRRRVNA